jgi:hypothetical protein
MADTNDPQPPYRITYLLAATKVAQEWAPDSLSRSKAYQILRMLSITAKGFG